MISRRPGSAALFRQLADVLRDRIRSGVYPAGSTLPSEKDLGQEHGLARETVRRAVGVLRSEGLVVTQAPYGSHVRETPAPADFSLQRGSRVNVRMPTPTERDELDLDDGVPVVVVQLGTKTRVMAGDHWTFVVK